MCRLVLVLALLSGFVAPARAYDIMPEVYGVAQFPKAYGSPTDLITFGDVTPGGGRAFNFGQFGQGGALCTDYAGEYDWLCASASASVDIHREPVGTTTYVGVATTATLKARVQLDYRNATATSAQIWAKAHLMIPIVCHGGVVPNGSSLHILYRLSGDYSVSVSDPAVTLNAPRQYEDCPAGAVCFINKPGFQCPEGASVLFNDIVLWPIIQIDNSVAGHLGWSVLGTSDYSHTFTLLGMEAVDDQGQPVPGVRLVVPGDGDAINDYFLTAAEAAEVEASSPTTTTTEIGATTTTSPFATTSTTLPSSCATADLAAAACLCAQRPAPGCAGVSLPKPVDKGVSNLCAKIAKATAASGKKQRKLAKQAVGLAKKTLRAVNGKKGNAIADACREGLRGFLQAEQTDAATATQ